HVRATEVTKVSKLYVALTVSVTNVVRLNAGKSRLSTYKNSCTVLSFNSRKDVQNFLLINWARVKEWSFNSVVCAVDSFNSHFTSLTLEGTDNLVYECAPVNATCEEAVEFFVEFYFPHVHSDIHYAFR